MGARVRRREQGYDFLLLLHLAGQSYSFMYRAFRRASERVFSFRNVWKSSQLGAAQCVAQRESDMPLAAIPVRGCFLRSA